MQGMLVENSRILPAFNPLDTTGAGATGLWVNMKFWRRLAIVLAKGAWAGGTSAVTLNQATSSAGAGSKALAFTVQYKGTGAAQTANNDQLSKNTVASNTFALSTTAAEYHVIEVNAQDLDLANGFAWVQVACATPGSNADLLAGLYILYDPAYAGLPSTLPSALG